MAYDALRTARHSQLKTRNVNTLAVLYNVPHWVPAGACRALDIEPAVRTVRDTYRRLVILSAPQPIATARTHAHHAVIVLTRAPTRRVKAGRMSGGRDPPAPWCVDNRTHGSEYRPACVSPIPATRRTGRCAACGRCEQGTLRSAPVANTWCGRSVTAFLIGGHGQHQRSGRNRRRTARSAALVSPQDGQPKRVDGAAIVVRMP